MFFIYWVCYRLELKLYPKQQSQLEQVVEEVEDLSYIDSLNGACQFEKPPPSPFSKKKVLYDNDEVIVLIISIN